MSVCKLCPNDCFVDRDKTVGYCGVGSELKIAKYAKFTLEEPCISGTRGSGAIFFCGCPMKCVFCQNYEVSRNKVGRVITTNEFIDIIKELEDEGVHNVNLVNPTHYVGEITKAFKKYRPKIPVVYNTHGYEKIETLKEIDEYVSVYLPDLKYFSPATSKRYSGKENYFDVASKAVEFMSKKPLVVKDGIMQSGCIIRHLILPLNTADSINVVTWVKERINDRAYLSLMSQYTPFGEIENYPELKRPITKKEYDRVLDKVYELGLTNVFVQDFESVGTQYIPVWDEN